MIYQTNKIRNFVFCLERFISSREINLFSRNSFFLTTGDPRHRGDETHVSYSFSFYNLQFLNKHRGDRGKMIHFFEIFFSCFYDLIYLIAFKCIMHCQVLATT